jgi:hypothetical protein
LSEYLFINSHPYIFHHGLAQPGGGKGKPEPHSRFYQYDAYLDEGDIDDHVFNGMRDVFIDGHLYQQRAHGRDKCQENGERHRQVKLFPVRSCIAEYPPQYCYIKFLWSVWQNTKVREVAKVKRSERTLLPFIEFLLLLPWFSYTP